MYLPLFRMKDCGYFVFMVPCITNLYYKCPTKCNNKESVCYFTAKSLYMFQVPFTPIIRSTWNCSYSHWYKSYLVYLLPHSNLALGHGLRQQIYEVWLVPVAVTTVSCTPDYGCERHLKHVEWFCSKIKYGHLIVASRWTFII